jgi:hypothetical protein
MVQTILIDNLARIAEGMRARGYPVRSISMRDDWMHREPDEYRDEGEVFWNGRSNERKAGFTAPIFDWELEDGRRFFGKPPVHTKRIETSVLGVKTVRYREDHAAMLADITVLILESCGPTPARSEEETTQ